MNYQPMVYESESIGTREYKFENEEFPSTYIMVSVDIQNTSQDNDLDDEAYAGLQKLMPISWHDWRLMDSEDIY